MPAPNELPEAVLLPCPFCGGAARIDEHDGWCGCGACGVVFNATHSTTAQTWQEIVADRWNRRTAGDGREGDARDAARWRKWLPWLRQLNRKPFNLAKEIDEIDTAMGAGQEG